MPEKLGIAEQRARTLSSFFDVAQHVFYRDPGETDALSRVQKHLPLEPRVLELDDWLALALGVPSVRTLRAPA